MRWIPVHEKVKVPVMKNLIWAVKILFKADKWFIISGILSECAADFFKMFVQGVLFLKVLLTVIEGSGTFEYYIKNLALFLIIGLATEIISVWGDYVTNVGQKKIFKALNNMIFEKASRVDISCYEDPEFYDKYQRASDILTNGYFIMFSWNLSIVFGSFMAFMSVITVVTSIDPAYLLFLLPVILVFIVEIIKSKVVYKRDLEMTTNNRIKSYTQRTVYLKEFSKDIRTSNIFSVIIGRFEKAVTDNIKIIKTYGWKLFWMSMLSSICGEFIPIFCTYAYSGYQFVVTKGLDVSGFSVVLSSINSVRSATTNIAESLSSLSEVALYFQNLRDFFEYESKVVSGNKSIDDFKSLELKNVSFKYPGAKEYSLKNINLKFIKGQTVAVVGINGAGKSTLVKLLLRFYDADEGEILYNGINIKEYNVDEYRNKFATVFQDYKTFAISVNENVMCRECSEDDKIKAQTALMQSGVWERICRLDNKGDTVLSREFDESGAGLSGGEAQKTAVARMFAKDFELAILDEPSSALDPIAEYKMYESLIEATKDKTVIYISHRLSSAVLSDIIYVLGNGQLLEKGSHEELINANGKYSEMFALQASSYNEEVEKDEI
ncbi:MAG: ABC transporter ATP-binding protein/permease [Acetobacter sp.]|nr:ABC transporter ATP-binding protein/permease [Bacteroides sp.]MCM1340981.1 ABC transporter ATP-binding protein/permease [Acetobacter sp.]MCM1432463.1 ABC transporter ATP-binding protein/permease [Clostridiales bacterium]